MRRRIWITLRKEVKPVIGFLEWIGIRAWALLLAWDFLAADVPAIPPIGLKTAIALAILWFYAARSNYFPWEEKD